MKKILMSVVCAAALCAVADDEESPNWLYFSSKGPDRYADGELVKDGEIYALVWSRTGQDGKPVSEFAMTADGAVTDPANHVMVDCPPIAKGHRCPDHVYVLTKEELDAYKGGVFSVFLFDTRTTAADGTVEVGKRNEDGTLACCNSYTDADVTVRASDPAIAMKAKVEVAATAADQTALPPSVPTPEVKIEPVGGDRLVVKAEKLVPYVKYTVYSKQTPTEKEGTPLVKGVSGESAGMSFNVSTKEAKGAFYQVVPEKR